MLSRSSACLDSRSGYVRGDKAFEKCRRAAGVSDASRASAGTGREREKFEELRLNFSAVVIRSLSAARAVIESGRRRAIAKRNESANAATIKRMKRISISNNSSTVNLFSRSPPPELRVGLGSLVKTLIRALWCAAAESEFMTYSRKRR